MLKTPDTFVPLMTPEAHPDPLTFVFRGAEILLREADLTLPDAALARLQTPAQPHVLIHAVGRWNGRYCDTTWTGPDALPQPGFVFKNMRALFGVMDDELLAVAGRAYQIAEWARTHRYCGACATPMALTAGERSFTCPACGMIAYPRISPAMMVLIKKGDAVLLAHHTHSPTRRFSPLAGFLEAGESIEEAVHREVFEEVGLKVDNIRYFMSQSWPFPHSLMIAYTADYVSGEIVVDQNEIAEARWFGPQHGMPEAFPYPEVSISGMLVNAHLGSDS
jgi:NAD+ diphosphatase